MIARGQIRFLPEDHRSAQGIAVPGKIFGQGMDNQVRSQLKRALQHRGGEGIFAGQKHFLAARTLGYRAYVDHFDQGVGRGLQPEELGFRAAGVAELFDIPHVHEGVLQPPAGEDSGDELADPEV